MNIHNYSFRKKIEFILINYLEFSQNITITAKPPFSLFEIWARGVEVEQWIIFHSKCIQLMLEMDFRTAIHSSTFGSHYF